MHLYTTTVPPILCLTTVTVSIAAAMCMLASPPTRWRGRLEGDGAGMALRSSSPPPLSHHRGCDHVVTVIAVS